MNYEWEADALDILHDAVAKINRKRKFRNSPFSIIGVAIVNHEYVEGAYFSLVENDGEIALSDVMQDICADAEGFYSRTIERRHEHYIGKAKK